MPANSLTAKNDEKNLLAREETRESERYIKPAVDIIESEEGLTLMADMPGAAKDALNVHVEKGILSISAPVSCTMPGHPIYTEFELARLHYVPLLPKTPASRTVRTFSSNDSTVNGF
jgi:HSP20 family molecular chaperone IbpA